MSDADEAKLRLLDQWCDEHACNRRDCNHDILVEVMKAWYVDTNVDKILFRNSPVLRKGDKI